MNLTRLAVPALTVLLGSASLQAMAQSSVTLYGVTDEAIQYGNNVGGGSQVAA